MSKKDLLDNISNVLENDSEESGVISELNEKISSIIKRENIISIIVYAVLLLLSLLMIERVDNLSFISIDVYLILLIVLLVATVGSLLYYIYINKDKENKGNLKIGNIFYQIFDIVNFIGVFLSIFLFVVLFIVTPVEVSGDSMETTFYEGDKILVWHIGYTPVVNDVVIIEANENYFFADNTNFVIKRVIAKSGDLVTFFDGIIGVNGKTLNRIYKDANGANQIETFTPEQYKMMMTDYVRDGENIEHYSYSVENERYEGVVPEGYCIVLGDNFFNSMDSKSVGLIHQEDILGKVIFRVYPFDEMRSF